MSKELSGAGSPPHDSSATTANLSSMPPKSLGVTHVSSSSVLDSKVVMLAAAVAVGPALAQDNPAPDLSSSPELRPSGHAEGQQCRVAEHPNPRSTKLGQGGSLMDPGVRSVGTAPPESQRDLPFAASLQ